MLNFLDNKYVDFLLDFIFPKYCVGCNIEETWLCDECKKKITYIKKPFCPNCHRLTPRGQYCTRCRSKSHLTGVIIIAHYEHGPLKEAIHTFKYDGVYGIAESIGNLIKNSYTINNIKKNSILVPVPLHKNRITQRGFNQALLIANKIKQIFPQMKINEGLLERIKDTTHQVELDRQERIKNIKNQFICKEFKFKQARTIYLVDDIFTTGATLNECARMIRGATNAKEVWAIVIAKG